MIEGLSNPSPAVYGLASVGTSIYVAGGDLTFSSDSGKSWNYLALSELTDQSAKSILKFGDKLIVSCSKGLLISSNPQQSWHLLPLSLNNQALQKMFTNGTDLFCLTEGGVGISGQWNISSYG